jgi:DNA modification methylase
MNRTIKDATVKRYFYKTHDRLRSIECLELSRPNTRNGSAKSKLPLHPTAKPVALVADAIRDCSHRSGIILDPFGGAGSTLIAAERTGRRARLIELEPRFVAATVRRWQTVTGKIAVNADTGLLFGSRSEARTKAPATSSDAAGALADGAQR